MPDRKSELIPKIHLIGDLIFLNLAFFIVNLVKTRSIASAINDYYISQFLYVNLFWIAATYMLKSYKHYRIMRLDNILNIHFRTIVFHLFLIFSFIVVFKQPLVSVKFFVYKYSLFVAFIFSWRVFIIFFLKYIRARGYNYKVIVIAGGAKIGRDFNDFVSHNPGYGYKCLGFFDDSEKYKDRVGSLADLEFFALNRVVDEIYCALPEDELYKILHLMSFADKNLIRLKILPDFGSLGNQKFEISFYDKFPVLNFRKDPLENIINSLFKRLFDIVFSSVVILLIFPWLFPLIAIGIKRTSKGPVFFNQLRSGRGNKPFMCFKFRTMTVNPSAHKIQATKYDPRITSIGRFLRSTSLDELPQFFNVLFGSMSVVGPRPHMLFHTQKYSNEIDEFMVRHFVKAGITGLAQIKGCRGETKNPDKMAQRVKWDLLYVENWTFFFDIKIIFITVIQMLRGKMKGE